MKKKKHIKNLVEDAANMVSRDTSKPLGDKNKYLRPELRYCITHEDAVRLLQDAGVDTKGVTVSKYVYSDGLIVDVLPPVAKTNEEVVVNPTNGNVPGTNSSKVIIHMDSKWFNLHTPKQEEE